jgi:transcriptional antiterminator RfaH
MGESLDINPCWYVLQTKPKQESRAAMNLRRWQIETLAPRVQETQYSRTGRLCVRLAPLFPNYLFARFEPERIQKVRLTRGVHRIVGLGEYATPIDDSVIDLIRNRIGEDGMIRQRELQPGEAVEIVHGPLKSFVGVFERGVSSRDRVLILINSLGSRARVEIARAAIRPTSRCVV